MRLNMKIGIFGGCFNPPHKMHEKIATELINEGYLDKVIYVPTGDSYEKNDLEKFKHRLKMLELITQETELLEVSDVSKNDNYQYTYQVLDYFKGIYPNDEIYFACGTDNLSYFDEWCEYKYILENYKLLIIDRKDGLEEMLKDYKEYRNNIVVTNIKTKNLSSTEIREKINKREDVSEFIEEKVLSYINENKLYL